ncbi:MAG: mannose-1-phosphate guanylyltransferase [Bifidobacteriaceae bacterium]|nr:mannose-1-phosphate guanylyltransferase [Bifidobacteriaceae bacterium]
MSPLPGFGAIVPAGGAGKRLWPVSQARRPKFLLDLTGAGRSLIQQTWDRLVPLAGAEGVAVVTGAAHAAAVRRQLPGLAARNLITEPCPRDSMPAIALAAAIAHQRQGDAVLGSFAADHVIGHQAAFERAVEAAYQAAREDLIATIGVAPAGPSTAYGYIKAGPPLGLAAAPEARLVEAFKEKPDLSTAAGYLQAGYRWNAGMFVFRAGLLLERLHALQPALAQGIEALARAWDTPQRGEVAARVWPTLPRVAIDHAIAEPVAAQGGLATVPGDFPWSDLGDFDSLAALAPDGGLRLAGGPAPVLVDSPGALVVNQTRQQVALLGLPDAVVALSDGVVLVTTRANAQRVKQLADQLDRA